MLIDSPDRAKRLARAIVSDIALYNKDLIKQGIENDNLFDVLAEDIEKGRQLYVGRVDAAIAGGKNFYNQALVDVLIKQYGRVQSKIW
jgi:hypothetical protein